MNKQWSLFVQWSETMGNSGQTRAGYVHFLWDGKLGKQMDYTIGGELQNSYTARFPNTDTYNGFVKWAYDCAIELPSAEFVLMPGCPECGSILDGKYVDCVGMWHAQNKPAARQLAEYMLENCPNAVAQADGNEFLAALNVMKTTANVVGTMWPIVTRQAIAVLNALRSAGIPIPKE